MEIERLKTIKKLVEEWASFLLSDKETQAAKMSFFLDTKSNIDDIMVEIEEVFTGTNNISEEVFFGSKEVKNNILQTMQQLKIMFGKINENITEEQATASVTKQSMSNAIETNESTKRMMSSIEEISNQKEPLVCANYMIYINNKQQYVHADSLEALNALVNQFVQKYPNSAIEVYAVGYKKMVIQQSVSVSFPEKK